MRDRRYVANTFVLATLSTLLGLTSLLGCSSKSQSQPPPAEEQKNIEQDQQKTMEQQKQLTSGYDKSMQYTPPSTGYVPNKQSTPKHQQGTTQQPTSQQQQSPPQSQAKQ